MKCTYKSYVFIGDTMTVNEIIPSISAKIICGEKFLDRIVETGFCCDMLSWVMSHLKEKQVWFTVLNSMNVIAVSSLTDCACVVLTHDVMLDADVLNRAIEKDVVILSTPLSTYEACISMAKILGEIDETVL